MTITLIFPFDKADTNLVYYFCEVVRLSVVNPGYKRNASLWRLPRVCPELEGPPWPTYASPDDRFTAGLTHLESTLIGMRASVDSKPLT